MNIIVEWFTKRKMLIGSLLMVFIYIVSYFNERIGLPSSYDNFCCIDDRKFNLFFLFVFIFVFALVSIKLNEEKYKIWKKFTLIYLIIYLFIYFVVPTHSNGYVWFQRETISFFGSIIYFVFSLFINLFMLHKKENIQKIS